MLKLIFRIFISFLTISLFYFNFESVSHAYLGPGVGGGIITATIGFVVAILAPLNYLLAVFSLLSLTRYYMLQIWPVLFVFFVSH